MNMKLMVLLTLSAFSSLAMATDDLRIGIEGEYPPFSEVTPTGELQGFDVDIAKALCTEMQAKCELVKISWDGLIPALKTRKIDAIVASMSATDERKKSVDFTDKYYSTNGRLVLKTSAAEKISEQNLADALQGKILGVQRGTVHDRYATDVLKDKVASIRRYDTQDQVDSDMEAGRINLTLADQIAMLTGFLNTPEGKKYAFAAPVFNDPKYYGDGISIAIRKGDDDLRQSFNTAIKNIRKNGVYKKINDKYFPEDIY